METRIPSVGRAPPLPPAPAQGSSAAPEEPERSRFSAVLGAVGRRIDQGEHLIARALTPRSGMDAAQLIALQAGIYRYTEAVELASKLVDRAGNAIRTTVQSQ